MGLAEIRRQHAASGWKVFAGISARIPIESDLLLLLFAPGLLIRAMSGGGQSREIFSRIKSKLSWIRCIPINNLGVESPSSLSEN